MSDHAPGSPYRVYFVTWGILLLITVAMLMAEKLHMPRLVLLAFLLVFMAVKAAMIGGNFMHLRYEKRNLTFIVTAGLVVTTLILFFFIAPETAHVREHTTTPVPVNPPAHGEPKALY